MSKSTKKKKSNTLTSISLFTGAGGLTLGLERAGIQAAVCVEKDPVCRQTIGLNTPDAVCLDDVSAVRGRQIKRLVGRQIDVIEGGPPCQAFSTIGDRRGLADQRGGLVLEYLRLVKEIRAPFIVMENVKGLLSSKNGDKPIIDWLCARLKRLGYGTDWWVLNSHDYGVAQKRERVVLIGALDGIPTKPAAVHPIIPDLRAAIGDLEDNPGECGKFSPKLARFLKKVPEGGCWKSLSKRDQDLAMGNANRASGGLTAFYRRLSYDRPSPTLLTSPTQRATTLCHPKHTRPLSVEEYRRIQGFPAGWQLAGTTTQKYRQLGNAVPVALAEAIGCSLLRGS